MSSFYDYYSGRPTPPKPVEPPSLPQPVFPGQGPVDPRYMLRKQYREEDPTEPDYGAALIGGSSPSITAAGLQVINPEDVIHGDFSTYLAGMGLERNGTFGGVSPSDPEADVGRVIPLIDAYTLTDPTGKGFRGLSKSGKLNVFSAMSINEEFEALNEIAKFNSANTDAVGNARGFAIRLGDQRGSILYRLPGSSRYQGDLSVDGKIIPQAIARNIENYTQGAAKGQQLLAVLKAGTDEDISKALTDLDFTNALINTDRGGYTLDGKFNAIVGVGRLGNLSDLKDLAQNQFRVVNNGEYNEVASNAIATSWLNGARSMGPDATQEQLIAHLQNAINTATKQSDVMKSNAKAGAKRETILEDAAGRPETFVASTNPEYQKVLRLRDTQGTGSGSGYDYVSAPPEERAIQAASEREKEYTFDAFSDVGRFMAEGGLNAARPGFVKDEDRLVPEKSILTVNELQGDVEESGFIDRPPSEVTDAESVADDIPMPEAEEDGYVINQEAVKLAGEMDLIKKIEDAERYVKSKGIELEKSKQPILASSGEIYVRPEVVSAIGLDELEKINKRGVPATKKKLKKTQRA